MDSRTNPTQHDNHAAPIRDRPQRGGQRLFDIGSRAGWSMPAYTGTLWLLPMLVAVGVAVAYLIVTGGPTSSQVCDAFRELKIEGPESCRNVVWVRAKSHKKATPITISKARSRNRRA